jgi:endonuclease-3
MTKEDISMDGAASRIRRQVIELERFYGLLASPPADPFMFFAWEVVSMRTTPGRRDAAWTALKRARALTPDSVARVPQAKLRTALSAAGPYVEQRLSALRAGADLFRRRNLSKVIRGPLAAARRALTPLPQMGDAGAHRMLLFAANRAVLPIDARLNRVTRRLGYGVSGRRSARALRRTLTAALPCDAGALRRAFVYLSHHGAVTCTEADPHCAVCPLLPECPEGKTRFS